MRGLSRNAADRRHLGCVYPCEPLQYIAEEASRRYSYIYMYVIADETRPTGNGRQETPLSSSLVPPSHAAQPSIRPRTHAHVLAPIHTVSCVGRPWGLRGRLKGSVGPVDRRHAWPSLNDDDMKKSGEASMIFSLCTPTPPSHSSHPHHDRSTGRSTRTGFPSGRLTVRRPEGRERLRDSGRCVGTASVRRSRHSLASIQGGKAGSL